MKNQLLFLLIAILFFVSNVTLGQHKISLKEKNGVLYLPCKINGMQLDYVFDTGASIVTINDSIYRLMQSNELISLDDSIGIEKYQDASGDIIECVTFNIKKIEIGGIVLENIKGGVVPNNNKSFLLGQSALKSIGSYNLDIKNKILEINDHALLIDGIYKRTTSADSVLNYIIEALIEVNDDSVNTFNLFDYNKIIQQPKALYRKLDSIINSEEYLMGNTKDTANLILAYAYLGSYYINNWEHDKGRHYIKKFIENENFLKFVIYHRLRNSVPKIYNCVDAIPIVLIAMVHDYYDSERYLECIKFGAKTHSFLIKYYNWRKFVFFDPKNKYDYDDYKHIIFILHEMANSKVSLSDYNGALRDIDTIFAYSKLMMDYYKYHNMKCERCEFYEVYVLKGICYYKLKKYAAAIAEIDKYFRKANLDLKKDEEEGVQTVNVENLSLAYFYRGLAKIELKNKQSGCADLSKSGELGFSDAYDVIQEKCN
jgi:hypothetical protein